MLVAPAVQGGSDPTLRLGIIRRPAFQALLWRLADHGIAPRGCPASTWCEPFDAAAFFAALPAGVDPSNESSRLTPDRAHKKRFQILAVARLVAALLPPAASKRRLRIVDFCGGAGHLGLVLAALHPNADVIVASVRC